MELSRLFAYDDWANREEVARLGAIDAPPRAVRLLAHIVGTEWLWISRLRSTKPRFAVWPELTIEQCANELDALRDAWNGYLHEAVFDIVIAYTNSLGESWTSRVGDVLTHVILHGAYHRGQIAIVVRDGGDEPAYTDYIHCTRNGFI
jgi:uncharacterized damage-inducible protein DinB